MSNASIIQRMRETCDQWDAGEMDSDHLKESLVGLACALEGVNRSIVEQAREWEIQIVVASDYGNYEGHAGRLPRSKKSWNRFEPG